MATVTKMIRWGETESSDTSATGNENIAARLCVGLLMDVSSTLLRDECESKLFALIPPSVKTVRGFKNHLATKIFKTHLPFHFYNGEYRIADEEDIRVFSLLNEPCKVVPVIPRKSALSSSGSSSAVHSTPIINGNHHGSSPPEPKRVKFSDSLDVSAFSNSTNLGTEDGLDTINIVRVMMNDNGSSETPDSPTKKPRKRRHRKHKEKAQRSLCINDFAMEKDETDNNEGLDSAERKKNKKPSSEIKESITLSKKRKTNAYDADVSEIDLSQKSPKKSTRITRSTNSTHVNGNHAEEVADTPTSPTKRKSSDKEFLSPNTAFAQTSYKPVRTSTSATKSFTANDHLYSLSIGSSGYSSTPATEFVDIGESCDSTGRRRDTPMLPKILKNPCATYEIVKRSLNFEKDEREHNSSDDADIVNSNQNGAIAGKNEENVNTDQDKLPEMQGKIVKSADEIKVGDTISFKVIEIGVDYSPQISELIMARVTGKYGSDFSLEYIDTGVGKKQRSGVLEIEDNEIRVESLDNPPRRNFRELREPRVKTCDA